MIAIASPHEGYDDDGDLRGHRQQHRVLQTLIMNSNIVITNNISNVIMISFLFSSCIVHTTLIVSLTLTVVLIVILIVFHVRNSR